MEGAVFPAAEAIECGEGKIRSRLALAAYDFAAAADVVLHPGRKKKVESVAADFAFVERGAGDEISDLVGGGFDHQVWAGVRAPVFGLDGVAFEIRAEGCERVDDEKMRADVA